MSLSSCNTIILLYLQAMALVRPLTGAALEHCVLRSAGTAQMVKMYDARYVREHTADKRF